MSAPRRNVELKATDPDPARSLRIALDLGAEDRGVIAQRDTYFRVPEGRLKLREETPGLATTGNADGLQQVLFNLVLNAIQAQPSGGEVEVVLLAAEEPDSLGTPRPRAVIEVRDRGPGVPEAKREEIFEPFATGRESSGGTGLGLAVVREIAREHNGSVRVLGRAGGGAVFRVSPNGQARQIIGGLVSPADLGVDTKRGRLLIPELTKNTLHIGRIE